MYSRVAGLRCRVSVKPNSHRHKLHRAHYHQIPRREVTVFVGPQDASTDDEGSMASMQTDVDEDGNVKIKIKHHHSGEQRLFSLHGLNNGTYARGPNNGWLPVLPDFGKL